MTSPTQNQHGYQLVPEELITQVAALTGIGEQTTNLASSASRLAQRPSMLGTAPPALHLAMRIHQAVGLSGLTGEINAASTELTGFHDALKATISSYRRADAEIARNLRTQGGTA